MQPDMWSGWGIRTLSAVHKNFNPFNYQTGAVWPHDNGFIAQGMKRYGFHAETCLIAEAITRAAGYLALDQMPELYAGTQRDDSNFPVQYIGANVPQGWAADRSSRFCKRCSASSQTRPIRGFMSTRRSPIG